MHSNEPNLQMNDVGNEVIDFYNSIYDTFSRSSIFQEVLEQVFAKEYIPSLENFSFITRNELGLLKKSLITSDNDSIILEMGCGKGRLTEYFAKRNPGLTIGIDISPFAIKAASCSHLEFFSKAYFSLANMTQLPFATHSINNIFSIDAIHYAKPFQKIADEIDRVLIPGGKLIFTHWTGREACLKKPSLDPLYQALLNKQFQIVDLFEIDPGIIRQLKVYAAIYDKREQFINELGVRTYSSLMNEARHMWSYAGKISRVLSIFSKLL